MARFGKFVFVLAPVLLSSGSDGVSLAQNSPSSGEQIGVVLSKLSLPVYPHVARLAHISGDVDLKLEIRQDGVIESVTVVSGHPLLKQAALNSVQQSQFDCRKCIEPVTAYRVVYTFKLEGESECSPKDTRSNERPKEQAYPGVSDAEHRVTVVGLDVCIVDPAVTVTWKTRSVKCLYLWKCGSQSRKTGLSPDGH